VDGLRERDNKQLRVANAGKREKADPNTQKQWKYWTRKQSSTAKETEASFAIANDALQENNYADTVICPRPRKKIPKREQYQAATATHRYMPPDHQAEMRFACGAASSGTEPVGANRGYTVTIHVERDGVCR
jgi:hypothetical protein